MKKLKVGDIVYIKEEEMKFLGELHFNNGKHKFKTTGPYRVDSIYNTCVNKLSGIDCVLSFERFELKPKELCYTLF